MAGWLPAFFLFVAAGQRLAHDTQGEFKEVCEGGGHLCPRCIKLHEFQDEYEQLAPFNC